MLKHFETFLLIIEIINKQLSDNIVSTFKKTLISFRKKDSYYEYQ